MTNPYPWTGGPHSVTYSRYPDGSIMYISLCRPNTPEMRFESQEKYESWKSGLHIPEPDLELEEKV